MLCRYLYACLVLCLAQLDIMPHSLILCPLYWILCPHTDTRLDIILHILDFIPSHWYTQSILLSYALVHILKRGKKLFLWCPWQPRSCFHFTLLTATTPPQVTQGIIPHNLLRLHCTRLPLFVSKSCDNSLMSNPKDIVFPSPTSRWIACPKTRFVDIYSHLTLLLTSVCIFHALCRLSMSSDRHLCDLFGKHVFCCLSNPPTVAGAVWDIRMVMVVLTVDWSEGCSLHVVALLDSIWIDKLHRLSLPTGKWAQLPFFGPASHWNPQSGWHYSYSKRETLRATQAPKIVNSPPLP